MHDSRSGVRPVADPASVLGRDAGEVGGPEPPVDDGRLKIDAVAALKVALTAAGPNVVLVLCVDTRYLSNLGTL